MNKNELLLTLAIDTVNWGASADFEMKELVYEYEDEIKKHYPQFFEAVNTADDDEDADNENIKLEPLCDAVQKDITNLLYKLRKKYEDPVEQRIKKEKAKKISNSLKALNLLLKDKIERWVKLDGKRVNVFSNRENSYKELILVVINDKNTLISPSDPKSLVEVKEGILELCPTGFASEQHVFRNQSAQFSALHIKDIEDVKDGKLLKEFKEAEAKKLADTERKIKEATELNGKRVQLIKANREKVWFSGCWQKEDFVMKVVDKFINELSNCEPPVVEICTKDKTKVRSSYGSFGFDWFEKIIEAKDNNEN